MLIAYKSFAMLAVAAIPSLCSGQTLLMQRMPTAEIIAGPERTAGPLALADFERIALERNPTLVQAGAQVRISQGKALQAGLHPNPSVGYSGEQIGVEGTAGEFHGIFVEQQIVTGGKLRLSRAKFAQEARQAQLQVLAQRYRILYSIRVAYYQALVQQQRLRRRERVYTNSDETLKTMRELVNVGQANRTDLLQSEIQLQRSKVDVQMAERRYQGAWEELTAIAGMPELQPNVLEDTIDLASDRPLNRDAALSYLLTCSPQLRFAQAEVVRDRIAIERERVEPIPNLNLRADTGYNAEAEDTVAGLELGIRVPLFDKNQGTIMQARAELTRAQAEVARIELILRRRFAQAFTEYEAALATTRAYSTEVLPRAEQVYELYLDSFKQRRAAWPQVLDAQREYYELYEDYLDNVLAARRSEAQINSFFLEDGLSQPPTPTPEGHRDATPRPR